MILLMVVISNVALVLVIFREELNVSEFLVAMCSIFAVADVLVPKMHPIREVRSFPVVFMVAVLAVVPLPHTGDHEIVIRHPAEFDLVDKRSARGRLKGRE